MWILREGNLLRSEVNGETGRKVKNGDGVLIKLLLMLLSLAMEEDEYGRLLDALTAVRWRHRRMQTRRD